MNSSSDYEGNNDEDAPKTPYDGEKMNASSNDEGNNYEVVPPNPPTNDININANSDDEKTIMRLSLIHLQMAEITKKSTMTKKKVTNKRPRRKQTMKT